MASMISSYVSISNIRRLINTNEKSILFNFACSTCDLYVPSSYRVVITPYGFRINEFVPLKCLDGVIIIEFFFRKNENSIFTSESLKNGTSCGKITDVSNSSEIKLSASAIALLTPDSESSNISITIEL